MLHHVRRVLPAEHRIEEPAVAGPVLLAGCGYVHLGVGERLDVDQVDRDPDTRAWRVAAQDVGGASVREEDVVRRGERVGLATAAGGVLADAVSEPRDDPRLVDA